MAAITTMPADAYALAGFKLSNTFTEFIHDADDFMAGDTRILQSGPQAVFYQDVAVADAAGMHFDSYPIGRRFGDGTFDDFEGCARTGYLGNAHGCWHMNDVVGLLRLRLRNFAQNRRMANDTFFHWSFFI